MRWIAHARRPLHRGTAMVTAAALLATQLTWPPRAEAAGSGASIASAGSVPPPGVTQAQAFQPDLFTGRATTSVPIAVPPGRKGIQPGLALSYSSSARNGWVGVGWGLDFGAIERSTKQGIPTYTDDDIFMVSFRGIASDLVRIPDGTYRLRDEGLFLRVERLGMDGWEVRDTSGTRYRFGGSADSEQAGPSGTLRWALRKITDPNGNTLTATYTKDQGQLYLSRIDYTGHETSGLQDLAPANRVDFVTESRPDVEVSYRAGVAVTTALRLKQVVAYAQNQLARTYVLAYTQSLRTGRSLLATITQVGADGVTSLPPTTFTYQDAASPSYTVVANNPAVSVAAWNVRKAGKDLGPDNFGCAHPYLALPWGAPIVVSGAWDTKSLKGTVNADGSLTASGWTDVFMHAWTWVYASSARSVTINFSGSAAACVWREDASGVARFGSNHATVSLPAGWSVIHYTAYHQDLSWSSSLLTGFKPLVDLMSPSQFIKPQLAGDADGDGVTDLIAFDAPSRTWSVSLSHRTSFSPEAVWLSGFGDTGSVPVLGDWDGDGRTDVATFTNGTWRFARSTGSAFQADALPTLTLGSKTPVTGDFNGDGLVDVGTYDGGIWTIAVSLGTGFTPAPALGGTFGTSDDDPLTGDFNGDGLTDVAVVSKITGNVQVALSNGSVFPAQPATWLTSFASGQPHVSADFNGDGLTDVAAYDRPTGRVLVAISTGTGFAAPAALPTTFGQRSADDGVQVADFNGDGLADPAVVNGFTGASELALSRGDFADLLSGADNGIGGTTTMTYQPSTQSDNTDPISGMPMLPFAIPVVSGVTVHDAVRNQSVTTAYTFEHGRYDPLTREFRGFGRVKIQDADSHVTATEFLQDDDAKGRPSVTEFRDAHGSPWTRQEHTWTSTNPYPGVHFVKLDRTDSFTYGGDATFRQTASQFQYDAFGHITRADELGDVSLLGDERATVTTYTNNQTAWILGKPSLTQTLDASGAVVVQRRFFYDGASDPAAPPTTGSLTKEEEWLNLPSPQWLATSLAYDRYGNVLTVTDALGRTTTNTYDPDTHGYLTRITNALGHSRQLAYDARFGVVTSSTDQNNVTSLTAYDALGRTTQTSFIDPSTTTEVVTSRTQYDLSAMPVHTVTTVYTSPNLQLPITSYQFLDGLGRTLQTRSPAEDPAKQVVSGAMELDDRGQVIRQWVPYLADASSSYVPQSLEPGAQSLASVTYEYDAVGRLLATAGPDGAVSSTSYDDWSVTVTDANGHQTRRTNDAYGHLATVEELNDGQTYTTTYQYDALGNLLQVQQWGLSPQGTVPIATTHITYDSLGRKIAMDDPDMGHWTYAYDAVDNLTSQTDARGVTITFTYDQLNRLTQKSYTVPPTSNIQLPTSVVYAYDQGAFGLGKLTSVTDGSGSSSFTYDHLGRLVTETKVVNGSGSHTISRTYDLLGRLVTLTYPDTSVAAYTYNAQGGIETVSLQPPASSLQPIVSDISYNAAGQLTRIAYGNGTVTDYSYNPQTLRLDQLVTIGPAGTLQDFSYAFDPVGNVTAITDRVHTGTQSFQYDDLDRLTQSSGAYGILTYAYDPLGNMTEKEGVAQSYGLPNGSKPHAVTSTSTGLALSYDPNGNLVAKDFTQSPSHSVTQSLYSFDAENRLVEVKTTPEATVSVTFQPGWNLFALPVIPEDASPVAVLPGLGTTLTQVSRWETASGTWQHAVGDARFDQFDILEYGVGYAVYCASPTPVTVSVTGKLPTQRLSQSLSADWHLLGSTAADSPLPVTSWLSGVSYGQVKVLDSATGNLAAATQIAPGQSAWVEVTAASIWTPPLPRNVTTQFVYDGDGGRVKQTTGSGTTTYVGEILEKDPAGVTTKYVFAGSQRLAAKTSAGELLFYHTDHLGSSDVITNATGAVVEHTEHLPYGAIARHDGPKDLPHQFTGQRQDAAHGLILFPARAYDPQLGRFLQADPLVADPGVPQSLNRYAYVRNNPINATDPTGLDPVTTITIVIEVVSIIVGWLGWKHHKAIRLRILPSPEHFFNLPLLPSSAATPGLPLLASSPGIRDLTEADIAQFDRPLEPIGLLDDPTFQVALFFSGPMIRGLYWASRTSGTFLVALGETGAVRIGAGGGQLATNRIAGLAAEEAAEQGSKVVVIGETMSRVKAYARTIGAEWYQAWKMEPFDKALALKRNERWIRSVIRNGYKIIDIGINPKKSTRSIFYGLEKEIIEALKYQVTR